MMRYHLLSGWITILFLISGFQAGNLQAGEALVCTDPVRLEIGAGQIETLQILLVNADNIYGIDLQATFDPAVVDADSEQTGVQMLSGVFLKPDFTVRNMADNKTGTLRYVVTQLNPTPPAHGTGIVLLVHFRGKIPGSSSKLTIPSVVIADRRGIKRPVTTRGADLVIVTQKPSTPTPHPTPTIIPTTPALFTASLTQARSQPSAQPSTTATRNIARTHPEATTAQNNPARVPERDSAVSDRVLTYVTVGGFSGSILLFGLTVWLCAAKRRKERVAKSN